MAISKLCMVFISPHETLRSYKITFVVEPDLDLCSKDTASGYVVVVGGLTTENSPFAMLLVCESHLRRRVLPSWVMVPRMVFFFRKYCIYSETDVVILRSGLA